MYQILNFSENFNNILNFSENLNNKLNCDAFTTLRLADREKYRKGKIFKIACDGAILFDAEIIEIYEMRSGLITQFVSYLDTGKSISETKYILKKFYPELDEDTELNFILLKKIK